MELIGQSLANALCLAGIYILISLGLTLVFSIMNIVQLAHGEIYMLGAYFTYWLLTYGGMDFLPAFILSAIITGCVGILLQHYLFRRVQADPERALVVSLGLILILQNVVLAVAGGVPKSYKSIVMGVIKIGHISVACERMGIVLLTAGLVFVVFAFLKWTKIGQAMIAIPQDRMGALLQGIDVDKIAALAMFIGCTLAAVAGSCVGWLFGITPTMGTTALTKAIAVVMIGGMGSLKGSVIAGLILGFVDGIIPAIYDIYVAQLLSFFTVIAILCCRPTGLFGHD